MPKLLLNDALVLMGIAYYMNNDTKQVRIIAKRWVKLVSTSNKKVLHNLLRLNDQQLSIAIHDAVTNYVSRIGD